MCCRNRYMCIQTCLQGPAGCESTPLPSGLRRVAEEGSTSKPILPTCFPYGSGLLRLVETSPGVFPLCRSLRYKPLLRGGAAAKGRGVAAALLRPFGLEGMPPVRPAQYPRICPARWSYRALSSAVIRATL